MPIHDWTRVNAGTWHDFHLGWIAAMQVAFNGRLLPPDSFYAQVERSANPADLPSGDSVSEAELTDYYASIRRTLVIRCVSDDSAVAKLETVSPGNKSA